jgi:hypothetical protein
LQHIFQEGKPQLQMQLYSLQSILFSNNVLAILVWE